MRHALLLCCVVASAHCVILNPKALSEYERKHARVALLAVPALAALSASGVPEPVKWLSQQPADTQLEFFAASAVLEAGLTLPRFTGVMELKEDVAPGRFRPLGPGDPALNDVELLLGRIAMIAAFGCLVKGL